MKKQLLAALLFFTIYSLQGQELTKEDYARAVSFMYNNYSDKVYNLHTSVNWFEDESGLWFIEFSKEGKAYKTVNFKNKKVTKNWLNSSENLSCIYCKLHRLRTCFAVH